MSNLIYLFLGLTIIISGDEIGSLLGYEYISLICNIVGACFMACGGKKYIDNVQETNRRNMEIQDVLCIMSEKLATTSDITMLKDSVKVVCENQNQIQTALNDVLQSEVNVITALEKESGILIEKVEKQVNKIISVNGKLAQSNDEANKILSAIYEEIVRMSKEVYEANNRNEEAIVAVKCMIEKTSETETSKLENVIECMGDFSKLPLELLKNTDELSEKINTYILNVTNEIKHLTQDMDDQDKKRTKNIRSTISEIANVVEDNNEEIAEQIKQLGQQYIQFENLVEKLIQQMTLMSENDYEVMKGFLDE